MAGVSKVERTPGVREMVVRMLEDGFTVTEIAEAVDKAGYDISRSSVGRYRVSWLDAMKHLHDVRSFAEIAVQSLADKPESMTAKANVALLESGLFRAITALAGTFDDNPAAAIKLLVKAAMAQAMLARAAKDDAEKTIKATVFAGEQIEIEAEAIAGPRTIQVEFVKPAPKAAEITEQQEETADGASSET